MRSTSRTLNIEVGPARGNGKKPEVQSLNNSARTVPVGNENVETPGRIQVEATKTSFHMFYLLTR